jgi:hypothetical protein
MRAGFIPARYDRTRPLIQQHCPLFLPHNTVSHSDTPCTLPGENPIIHGKDVPGTYDRRWAIYFVALNLVL